MKNRALIALLLILSVPAQALEFIAEAEIGGLTENAWTTVTAPGAVPAGASGVFGYFINGEAFGAVRNVGVRHPTDGARTDQSDMRGGGAALFFIVGLDGTKQFDYFVEGVAVTPLRIIITGYFTTDATFKTAPATMGFTKNATWQRDIDLTATTDATATAAILERTGTGPGRRWGAQHSGDAADKAEDRGYQKAWTIVPMGAGQLLDMYEEEAAATWKVIGYLTAGVVDTAMTDATPVADATWTTKANAGATATAALVSVYDDSGTQDTVTWGARKDVGSMPSFYPGEGANGAISLVELDGAADFEIYASDVTTEDTFVLFMASFSAPAATSAAVQRRRYMQ